MSGRLRSLLPTTLDRGSWWCFIAAGLAMASGIEGRTLVALGLALVGLALLVISGVRSYRQESSLEGDPPGAAD